MYSVFEPVSLLYFEPIFRDNAAPDASGSKVRNEAKAIFFCTADFFATASMPMGSATFEALAARLKVLGLLGAKTVRPL